MPAASRPRRCCRSRDRSGRRPGGTRQRPGGRGGPTTPSERVEAWLWPRACGLHADPAAHPRARLALVEGVACDLQHIMPAVGFVADSWCEGMRLKHPRTLERERIEPHDSGWSPRHPNHAIILVAEAISGLRVPPAAVKLEEGVGGRAAELKQD